MREQFINTGHDDRIIESLFKSIQNMDVPDVEKDKLTEELEKSINKAGLIQKEVQVRGKNGQIFIRKQWVKASEEVKQDFHNQEKSKRELLPVTPHSITEKTKHLIPWSVGEELPEYIRNLNKPIPPNWRNVMISKDPNADLLVIGKDDMNRTQYIYSEKFTELKKSEKFNRIKMIKKNLNNISEYIDSLSDKETSDCLKLILTMGIRPGSTADTKSAVKAYGATTLKGQHVIEADGKVYLQFVGKKGVNQKHEVSDPNISDMLLKRKKNAGYDGDLFNTTSTNLRVALKPIGIKPKDLRTNLATQTAVGILLDITPVTDVKEFVKIRNQVGDNVCKILGNQRTMALGSYIDPKVFENWSPQGYNSWKMSEEQKKNKS